MNNSKINRIDFFNLILYFIYISLMGFVAYFDRYNESIASIIRYLILLFNLLIPITYNYLLKIKFKNTVFFPLIIIAILFDIFFSFVSEQRQDQFYRLTSFLLSFPTSYLLFFANIEYKNKFSSKISQLMILLTLGMGALISNFTPTIGALENLAVMSGGINFSDQARYNFSSVELYYISILIIYASLIRLKISINRDRLNPFFNILTLIKRYLIIVHYYNIIK